MKLKADILRTISFEGSRLRIELGGNASSLNKPSNWVLIFSFHHRHHQYFTSRIAWANWLLSTQTSATTLVSVRVNPCVCSFVKVLRSFAVIAFSRVTYSRMIPSKVLKIIHFLKTMKILSWHRSERRVSQDSFSHPSSFAFVGFRRNYDLSWYLFKNLFR